MIMDLPLAQATDASLVSWWKMLLVIVPVVAWARLASAAIDKDARYFHLNHRLWNGIGLGCAAAGVAVMLAVPIFWVGWPIGMIVLATPILAYWQYRNRNVPEDQKFSLGGGNLTQKLETRRAARAARAALIRFIDSEGNEPPVPGKDDPRHAVHIALEDLLGPAVTSRVSRLELALGSGGCAVAQTIDGMRYKRETIPAEAAAPLFDYVKELAGLNVEDKRRRQRGTCRMDGPAGKSDLAVVTRGSSSGQMMQIEIDRAKRLSKPFDSLGLLAAQIEALRTLEEPHDRHGIILVGAPSGHGLTTSGYSFVSRHDAYTSNVKTLEREVQIEIEGVDQMEWDAANPDVDYATALQSILRRDPDIVLVDLVKDADTARVVADPGMQGPLIYVPQALPSIADQVRQWVKQVGDVKKAVRPLRAVTNQRLLRSLCPNCRQAFQPSSDQLRKLNLSPGKVKQLYRASGKVQIKNKIDNCPVCGGSGYLGQTAAFEVMMVDDEARKILASGDLKAALAHARRNKMIYLQEAALSKVVNGETTIEEVIRVTAPSKSEGARPKPVDAA
jgi:general secretion pathway protein E